MALALVLPALAACGGGSMFGSSSGPSASSSSGATTSSSGGRGISDRISDFISSPSKPVSASSPGAPGTEDIDCPRVDIRQGASTLSIMDPKAESPAMGLRYQGTIVRTARECAVRDRMVTIRVGVQGRVIAGPAGGPGSVTVPLRYALVMETADATTTKTIFSKLYQIPVTVAPGETHAVFSHVEETMTVPMPSLNEFDYYVIYVGYDPQGALDESRRRPQAKPAARPQRPRS